MTQRKNEQLLESFWDHSQAWSDIISSVVQKNQETLKLCWENPNFFKADKPISTIFDPEIIQDVLSKAVALMAQKPEALLSLQQEHLRDVNNLLNIVLKKIQNEDVEPVVEMNPRDRRFRNPVWSENPVFFFMQQLYLINTKLLEKGLDAFKDLDPQTHQKLSFYVKHMIDAGSPTNFPLTNPDVIEATMASKGENLVQGFRNFLKDTLNGSSYIEMSDKKALKLGRDIATTPGKVVFRNELFELIQYSPTTKQVAQVPLLIIPPWINKFYVFDLRPENSFVRWAVEAGFTVFIMSWINPDARYAEKTLADYMLQGAFAAVQEVSRRTKEAQVNTLGYCTGGILLNCLMSYLKQTEKDHMIKSATLIAAPLDFKEAGEMLVFICEQQLKKLEKHVRKKGFLAGEQMVQAFNLLRANDLIWSFYVNNYLMGRDPMPFDMLHWNTDSVHMPAALHLDFLKNMYLENRLVQPGGISLGGVPIDMGVIQTPSFVFATSDDHIAPWRAVYPLTQYFKGEKKFVLGGSGHVAGVFNPPHRHKYHYWTADVLPDSADAWFDHAQKLEGSWWGAWREWMQKFNGGDVAARQIDEESVLADAPGTYVQSHAS